MKRQDKMKQVTTALAVAMLMGLATTATQAASHSYTERECSTDSYGNTTCRDKTVNVETGVITYSNQTVTRGYATTGVVQTGYATTGHNIQILNTGKLGDATVIASVIVALGGAAVLLKAVSRVK